MGNCLTCFKEPPSAAQQKNSSHYCKEEMPDTRLYSAPNHNYQESQHFIPSGTACVSYGNSAIGGTCATAVTSTTLTGHTLSVGGGIGNANSTIETCLISNGNQLSAPATLNEHNHNALSRLYAPYHQKRPMGSTDSKPSSDTKLHNLFDQYKDDSDIDIILAEGVEQLCKDLMLSPDEFRVLLFAWQLNAEQMCRFTRTEFVTGMKRLRCETIKGVQTRLPELVVEVSENNDLFKDLYRFTFRFGLDMPSGQRILPTDMAILLWRLVFTVREPPILNRWLTFLQCHESVRGIPKDTWNMFLNFSDTVGNDLSSYDDNEAWPSLFDDFVEFENDQANQNISKEKDCNKRDEETNCQKRDDTD